MYVHLYVRPSFIRVMWPHTHVSQAVRANKDESDVTLMSESWHTRDHTLNIIITHSLFVTDTALNSLQCLYDRDTALNSVIRVTCDMTQSYVWHLTNTSWQYCRDSDMCAPVAWARCGWPKFKSQVCWVWKRINFRPGEVLWAIVCGHRRAHIEHSIVYRSSEIRKYPEAYPLKSTNSRRTHTTSEVSHMTDYDMWHLTNASLTMICDMTCDWLWYVTSHERVMWHHLTNATMLCEMWRPRHDHIAMTQSYVCRMADYECIMTISPIYTTIMCESDKRIMTV